MQSLERFVDAQDAVFDVACVELAAGAKRSHWMWFVFPQLRALGRSATALHYGLADLDEARAYRAHALLGPHLVGCVDLVLAHQGRSAHAIFGSPDDLKLRSCMTLFEAAVPDEPRFARVIELFFSGVRDPLTLAQLNGPCASESP